MTPETPCPLGRPVPRGKGRCWGCGQPVPPRARKWCSERCSLFYWRNHSWGFARPFAIARAGGWYDASCDECGARIGARAEVNHVVPREGRGYGKGCAHHQTNLQVLCHACHVAETTRQRRERAPARVSDPTLPLWS